MSDLRIGLVEAMTRAFINAAMAVEGPLQGLPLAESELKRIWLSMPAAVDGGLGFLTDNAEATVHVEYRAGFKKTDALENICVQELIAALSDSRDTGEKP